MAAFRVNKSSDEVAQPSTSISPIPSGNFHPDVKPLPTVAPSQNPTRLPPISSVLSEQLAMPPHHSSSPLNGSGGTMQDVGSPSHALQHWRRIMQEDRTAGVLPSRTEQASHYGSPNARNLELRSTSAISQPHGQSYSIAGQEGLGGHGRASISRSQSVRHVPAPPEQANRRSERTYVTPESSPSVSTRNSPLPRPAPSMSQYPNNGNQHRRHMTSLDTVEANVASRDSPPTLSHLRKMHQLDLGNVREGPSRPLDNNTRLDSEELTPDGVHRRSVTSVHSSTPMPSGSAYSSSHYHSSRHNGETGPLRACASPPLPSPFMLREAQSRPASQADRARLTSSLNPQQPSRIHRNLSDHGNSSTHRGPITVQFQETPKAVYAPRNTVPSKMLERSSSTYSDGSGSESERYRHRSSHRPSSSKPPVAESSSSGSTTANRHPSSRSSDASGETSWIRSRTTSSDVDAYGYEQRRQFSQTAPAVSTSETSRNQVQQLPPIRTTPNSAAPVISARRTEALPGYLHLGRETVSPKPRSSLGFPETHEASRDSYSGSSSREMVRHSPEYGPSLSLRTHRGSVTNTPPPTGATTSPHRARDSMFCFFIMYPFFRY